MMTITVAVPDGMFRDIGRAADLKKLQGNDHFVFEATRAALRGTLGPRRGKPYQFSRSTQTTKRRTR